MPTSPIDAQSDNSRDEVWIEYGANLLASAPVPIRLSLQNRFSLGRLQRQELHCLLKKGKLHVTCYRPWKIRHIQIAELVSEALAKLGVTTIPPFYINTSDKPNGKSRPITEFANCSVEGYADVAAPDFTFNGWPEAQFRDFDAKAADVASHRLPRPLTIAPSGWAAARTRHAVPWSRSRAGTPIWSRRSTQWRTTIGARTIIGVPSRPWRIRFPNTAI